MSFDLRLPSRTQPIVVALSGGVDSAVCAGLLAEAGYPVVGITMRLYNAKGTTVSSGGRCCGPRDIEDARAICEHLNIPFYVANYEQDFEEAVIDPFVKSYVEGRTPNPCVRCNQHIKFTPLLYRAQALGAAALCTGHYARLQPSPSGGISLHRGKDHGKDQSYFLFGMPKTALSFIQFPLGSLTKEEVRSHAERLSLPNAKKPESQEICFVPDGNQAAFVQKKLGRSLPKGTIVDMDGQEVGTHDGVHHFTIGQRRGIGVAMGEKAYVVSIDALTNRVRVGSKQDLATHSAFVEEVCFLGPDRIPGESFQADVQIRYRHKPKHATIRMLTQSTAHITFDTPEYGVAPGQAAVFYDGDEVIGGGFLQQFYAVT